MAHDVEQLDHDALTAAILHGLSRPPSQPGLRLRSERDLSERLGVGRRRIGYALERLVDMGLLVRRGGSGTYVHRVPARTPPSVCTIAPDDLFSGHRSDRDADPTARLLLGLWCSKLDCLSRTNRLVLDGVLDRAQELGHILSLHADDRQVDSVSDLAARVSQHHRDGLLLSYNRWTSNPQFQRQLAALLPDLGPTLTFFTASIDPTVAPLVFIDTHAAIPQAVAHLARAGRKRIAMIALPRWTRMAEIYAGAMADAGLPYRAVAQASRDWAHDSLPELPAILDGREQMTRLLALPKPPDAVYVADDSMMHGVAEVLAEHRLVPGRDIAVLTHEVLGKPLPPGCDWSRWRIDAAAFGRLLLDQLLARIRDPQIPPAVTTVQGVWVQGQTCPIS